MIGYDMIYLLTAIGVVQYTLTHKQYTEQDKIWEECGPCPVFELLAPIYPATPLDLFTSYRKIIMRVRRKIGPCPGSIL